MAAPVSILETVVEAIDEEEKTGGVGGNLDDVDRHIPREVHVISEENNAPLSYVVGQQGQDMEDAGHMDIPQIDQMPKVISNDQEITMENDLKQEVPSKSSFEKINLSVLENEGRSVSWIQAKEGESHRRIKQKSPRRSMKRSPRLTKSELENYLPRKNFFNSHDKVLKDAGFDVDDNDKSRKKPDWKKILRLPSYVESEKEKQEREKSARNRDSLADGDPLDEMDPAAIIEMSTLSAKKNQKTKQKEKKLSDESYKPLLDYLKYIGENPTEYLQLTKFSFKNMDHTHPNNLVRMARAFKKWHHGTARDNIFIHAVSILKPKFTEPPISRVTKDKPSRKEASQKQETSDQGNSEEGKTELEKLKIKCERWMKGLSTTEWLKARESSLMDLGQEDINYSRWWLAFQNCSYLRQPHPATDTTMVT